MVLNRPSVYNHYNRVRANMSHMFDTTEDTIMGESMSQQLLLQLFVETLADGDISAARLRPLRNSHSSLLSRRHSPVFEKSNVLVMYVMSWILLITPLSIFQRSNGFRSVFSFHTSFFVPMPFAQGKRY